MVPIPCGRNGTKIVTENTDITNLLNYGSYLLGDRGFANKFLVKLILLYRFLRSFEFFFFFFVEILEFMKKNINGVGTYYLLCKRQSC